MLILSILLAMSLSFDGNVWRAAFVSLLAIILFALARYWTDLRTQRRSVRVLLIVLRGGALLLLAAAFAGLRVERDGNVVRRVVLREAASDGAGSGDKAAVPDATLRRQVNDALAKKNLETVEDHGANETSNAAQDDAPGNARSAGEARSALSLNETDDSFAAGVLTTDAALSAKDAAQAIAELRAKTGGAPVFVVTKFVPDDETRVSEASRDAANGDAPRVALRNVALLSETPLRGAPIGVRCVIHGHSMNGRETLLTIVDEAQAVRASAKVRWTLDDEWQTIQLNVVPKTTGWMSYTARIEAASAENPSMLERRFALYATERRVHVLFFEGEPTWEAKFIRRALSEAELFDVDYFAQVGRAAIAGQMTAAKKREAKGAVNDQSNDLQDEAARQGNIGETATSAPEAKLHELLSGATRLDVYDCIIVGPTPNDMLSAAETARVREWVWRHGGGLIVLGGNSFSGSIVAPNGKLYALLPTEVDARGFASDLQAQAARGVPIEATERRARVALTPTEAGASGALGAYKNAREAEAATNAEAKIERAKNIDALTGEGLRLGALRPGAIALATTGASNANGTSETGAPLVAARRDGMGRELIFAPADSWRIRTASSGNENAAKQARTDAAAQEAATAAGDTFGALWQGLVLWAVGGVRAPIELALSDASPMSGYELTAELRARDAAMSPLKIEKVNARLQPLANEAEVATAQLNAGNPNNPDIGADKADAGEVAFAPDEQNANVWRARFRAPLAPGRFALEVDYETTGGKKGSLEKRFAVFAQTVPEPNAARDTLTRAARATGGDIFSATQIDALAEQLAAASNKHELTTRAWELRTWPPLFIIIALLLAAEWFAHRLWETKSGVWSRESKTEGK